MRRQADFRGKEWRTDHVQPEGKMVKLIQGNVGNKSRNAEDVKTIKNGQPNFSESSRTNHVRPEDMETRKSGQAEFEKHREQITYKRRQTSGKNREQIKRMRKQGYPVRLTSGNHRAQITYPLRMWKQGNMVRLTSSRTNHVQPEDVETRKSGQADFGKHREEITYNLRMGRQEKWSG